MNPIEQLRFLARSEGLDQRILVQEAANALGFFSFERRALLTACRQLLGRHSHVGSLWWLCGRMVLSGDPQQAGWEVIDEMNSDQTLSHLVAALGPARIAHFSDSNSSLAQTASWEVEVSVTLDGADVVIVEALAAGQQTAPDVGQGRSDRHHEVPQGASIEVLLSGEGAQAWRGAVDIGLPVWVVLGPGCLLPDLYWAEVLHRTKATSESSNFTRASLSAQTRAFLGGVAPAAPAVNASDIPPASLAVAPELLVRLK